MTARGRGAALLCCLLLGALPAAADIVVTGRRADAATTRAEALGFARTVEAPPVDGQIARWNEPVCPAVGGLDAPVAAIVAARIRVAAAGAGAEVGRAGCRGNVIVAFTLDARAAVAAMVRRRPRLLPGAGAGEQGFIRDSDAPVRWWYVAATEGADGTPLAAQASALIGTGIAGGAGILSNGRQAFVDTRSSSLLRSPFRVSLKGVVVLVDAPRAAGAKLTDVAAYVAFVALARIKAPPPVPATPSILALFAGGTGGLSADDAAYLKALYAAPVDRSAGTQRSRMTVAMARMLADR